MARELAGPECVFNRKIAFDINEGLYNLRVVAGEQHRYGSSDRVPDNMGLGISARADTSCQIISLRSNGDSLHRGGTLRAVDALLRRPFPAQTIAIMGVVERWQRARTAMVVAEGGTGKILISFGAIHVHSKGHPSTALAMVAPHLV